MSVFDNIKKLTNQLLPTGRAFRLDAYGNALNIAVAELETQLYNDSVSLLDSLMPDTTRFTAEDCTNWERILGLPTNASNTLADRRAAILRKMSNPGINPAKGHYLVIQEQLRLAGFDVYVHENMFPVYPNDFGTYNPAVLNPLILSELEHGMFQHGGQSHYINQVVANSISNDIDIEFNVGDSLNATFFIGGSTLGTYANVSTSREVEFRQLILTLKQAQTVAYLFINYI